MILIKYILFLFFQDLFISINYRYQSANILIFIPLYHSEDYLKSNYFMSFAKLPTKYL